MNLADKTQRHRQISKPVESVIQSEHIVLDLLDGIPTLGGRGFSQGFDDITKAGLSAFDLARKGRLLINIHTNKQVNVGQH